MTFLSVNLDASINKPHLVNEKVKNESTSVWLHLLTLPISSQVTIGLAKIFDFEILTHGTTFTNCYGILKNGADPSKGGSDIGSALLHKSPLRPPSSLRDYERGIK